MNWLVAHWRRFGSRYCLGGALGTLAAGVYSGRGGYLLIALIWAFAGAVSLRGEQLAEPDDDPELTDDEADRLLAELRRLTYRPETDDDER